MLATFEAIELGDVTISRAPEVSLWALDAVADGIVRSAALCRRMLGHRPFPPPLFVYADRTQMLAGSCANQASVAYFDGAIHVAAGPDLERDEIEKSASHEYVHHVLLEMGLGGPMWLQEGLAAHVADETWWRDPEVGVVAWLATSHLPFGELVEAFPHTCDEPYALRVYAQSLMMVRIIVASRGEAQLRWLAESLAEGDVMPADAFSAGLAVPPDEIEALWWAWLPEITR
jgi:hypothetical protein